MKFSYEEHMRDRIEMPSFDESIFYPEIETRKLGFTGEDTECIAEYFRWQLKQRNRRIDKLHLISILKLRAVQLIAEKKSELACDIEALNLFSK